MRKIWLGTLIILSVPFAAMAQPGYPPVEVFGGYSYFRANPEEFNLNGWNASIAGNVTNWFGIQWDFSGHYGHPTDQFGRSISGIHIDNYTFMMGPRLAYRAGSFTPFAHFLLGAARAGTRDVSFGNTSDWALAAVIGGGVDLNVSRSVAVRMAQVDYLMTRFDTGDFFGDNRQNNFRFSAGIVFKLGSR